MKSFLKPPLELRNGYKDKKHLASVATLGCLVCKLKNLKQTTRTVVHHKIGMGIGKKASDRLVMSLCDFHHNNTSPESIHNIPLWVWEERYYTQDDLIEITNKLLEKYE